MDGGTAIGAGVVFVREIVHTSYIVLIGFVIPYLVGKVQIAQCFFGGVGYDVVVMHNTVHYLDRLQALDERSISYTGRTEGH
jgi:hypothetical protein